MDTLGFELRNKVLELQTALLDRHPRMPNLLQEIHRAIKAQPEQVTILSDEEISIIVNGLKIQTQVEFVTNTKAPSATKSLKAKVATLKLDDI